MSLCLVAPLDLFLWAQNTAGSLPQYNFYGFSTLSTTFYPGTNFLSHVTCPEVSQHATNSAYIVDDAVTDCLDLFHDIAPFCKSEDISKMCIFYHSHLLQSLILNILLFLKILILYMLAWDLLYPSHSVKSSFTIFQCSMTGSFWYLPSIPVTKLKSGCVHICAYCKLPTAKGQGTAFIYSSSYLFLGH